MKRSRSYRILMGVGTGWLVLFPFLAAAAGMLIAMFTMAIFLFARPGDEEVLMIIPFLTVPVIMPLAFITVFVQFALLAAYLIEIIRNTQASEAFRIACGLGIFFMPYIAMPIYYYAFLRDAPPPEWALASAGPGASS